MTRVQRSLRSQRLLWGALGLLLAVGMLATGSAIGAVLLFVVIALWFVAWHLYGGREIWVALLVGGTLMTGILGWAAVTSAGCPTGTDRVMLKAGKPSVDCEEIRAGYVSMAAFFIVAAMIGAALPGIQRRRDQDELDARTAHTRNGIAPPPAD